MQLSIVNNELQDARYAAVQADKRMDEVEVVLSNLIALVDADKESFGIPFDDVIVTIKLAVRILAERNY